MNGQFWTSVSLGGVVSAVIWSLAPTDEVKETRATDQPEVKKVRVVKGDGRSAFFDLKQADSDMEKLIALERLQRMELKRLRLEFEEVPKEEFSAKLTFAMKAMILRLAEIDPVTAVEFIREHWEDEDDEYFSQLNQSWKLVSAEWAHQDPLEMMAFWEETQKTQNHPLRIYRSDLANLLLAGRPLGWMTLYHLDEHQSVSSSMSFLSRLRSGKDFQEALETWRYPSVRAKERWDRELAEAKTDWDKSLAEERSNPKKNSLAQEIIRRWREVDEAAFLKSEFVEWEKGE